MLKIPPLNISISEFQPERAYIFVGICANSSLLEESGLPFGALILLLLRLANRQNTKRRTSGSDFFSRMPNKNLPIFKIGPETLDIFR